MVPSAYPTSIFSVPRGRETIDSRAYLQCSKLHRRILIIRANPTHAKVYFPRTDPCCPVSDCECHFITATLLIIRPRKRWSLKQPYTTITRDNARRNADVHRHSSQSNDPTPYRS